MDVFHSYTYGSAGWLALQAAPLIVSPTVIVALLSPHVREATVLEEYFSRSLGMALLALGIMMALLTGSVPLTSSSSDTTTKTLDPQDPYAFPALTVSLVYHAASAFFCYTRYNTSGQISFAIGALGSVTLASVGLWCVLFASSSGRISKKTGADKRTSGFPFSNKESASAKKKQMGKSI